MQPTTRQDRRGGSAARRCPRSRRRTPGWPPTLIFAPGRPVTAAAFHVRSSRASVDLVARRQARGRNRPRRASPFRRSPRACGGRRAAAAAGSAGRRAGRRSPGRHWTRSTRRVLAQLLEELARRRPSPPSLSSVTPGRKVEHDPQRVHDVRTAHGVERVVRAHGLRALGQPVAERHGRVEAPRLRREQQQRGAGDDEREHRPRVTRLPQRRHAVGARRGRAPGACGGCAARRCAGRAGTRTAGRSVTESSSAKTVTSRPAKPDRAQLRERDRSAARRSRSRPGRRRGGSSSPRAARPPRRRAGLAPRRERLAEAADRQQRVVDAEAEADHRGEALDQDRDREEAGEERRDAEGERRSRGRRRRAAGSRRRRCRRRAAAGAASGAARGVSAERASAALAMRRSKLSGTSPVQPSQTLG